MTKARKGPVVAPIFAAAWRSAYGPRSAVTVAVVRLPATYCGNKASEIAYTSRFNLIHFSSTIQKAPPPPPSPPPSHYPTDHRKADSSPTAAANLPARRAAARPMSRPQHDAQAKAVTELWDAISDVDFKEDASMTATAVATAAKGYLEYLQEKLEGTKAERDEAERKCRQAEEELREEVETGEGRFYEEEVEHEDD
ncbi:MAG: hypothetical protein M1830_007227 [Pleopsidium flavum]|nr:MAG: hypothetical protein M1830_007227 [Pleopsidium flavum]